MNETVLCGALSDPGGKSATAPWTTQGAKGALCVPELTDWIFAIPIFPFDIA